MLSEPLLCGKRIIRARRNIVIAGIYSFLAYEVAHLRRRHKMG